MDRAGQLAFESACLFVSDITTAVAFYTRALGMTVRADFGKNVILDGGVTLWEVAPDHILAERLGIASLTDRGAHRFELYFETEDLDAAHAQLESNGVDFVHPIHEEPWGQRTLRFFDPDGH